MSNFGKRLAAANRSAGKSLAVFEQLEKEFLSASAEQRQIHNEIADEIQRLSVLQSEAFVAGTRNQDRAEKLRELFL